MHGSPKKLHRSPRGQSRIILAGSYQAAKGVHFPPHRHTYWELVYYRAGRVLCLMDGKAQEANAGVAWLTPPGVVHAERALTYYSNHFIGMEGIAPRRWPAFLIDDLHQSLGRVCGQIVVEKARRDGSAMLGLLTAQLALLLDRAAAEKITSPAERAVLRAERWLDENSSVLLRDVAAGVGVSPSALRHYFATVRRYSPRDYLRRVRIEKAAALLRSSNLKLEMVAELCGFDSASHLTRQIKREFDQTPGQLRERTMARRRAT